MTWDDLETERECNRLEKLLAERDSELAALKAERRFTEQDLVESGRAISEKWRKRLDEARGVIWSLRVILKNGAYCAHERFPDCIKCRVLARAESFLERTAPADSGADNKGEHKNG